jgi:hypothetical protein
MSRYQAIRTYYYPPTNHRGAKCKAVSASGLYLTTPWDENKTIEDNHISAARALACKYSWNGSYVMGGLDKRGFVFVCADLPEPFIGSTFRVGDRPSVPVGKELTPQEAADLLPKVRGDIHPLGQYDRLKLTHGTESELAKLNDVEPRTAAGSLD